MEKRRRKRKLKIGRIVVAIIILIIILLGVIFIINKGKKIIISKNELYLAADNNIVKLYILDEEENMKEEKEVPRGTKVTSYNDKIDKDNTNYTKIEYEKNNYYVISSSLVKNIKDVVLEKEKYVRTSVTVYENETDSKILPSSRRLS